MERGVEGGLRSRVVARLRVLRPEHVDALLYAGSAAFAALTVVFSSLVLYRTWGAMAVGPYTVAAGASWWLAHRRAAGAGRRVGAAAPGEPERRESEEPEVPDRGRTERPWRRLRLTPRLAIFLVALVGATLVPLGVEIAAMGQGGNQSAHVQPEVVVIEQAGSRLAHGQDPYLAVVTHGRVVSTVPGEPTYESFFPYLPLMAVFGLPASAHGPVQLTDARIFFSLVTLVIVALALALCRGPGDWRFRAFQVAAVLPTAALPLATGGDDMPIVAFLLLAMVLAQRRRPVLSGLVLGVVSAMKFTAWPLAALALFAARDRRGRRAPLPMLAGMLVVAGPVVLPFVVRNPRAFIDNVILFPLGLAGVASPAASPLPGHLLVSLFPSLHRVLPVAVAVVGGAVLVRHLVRHPPRTAADASLVAGWVMLVAIALAPATRVGYLLYPVNFFVWVPLLRAAERWDEALAVPPSAGVGEPVATG